MKFNFLFLTLLIISCSPQFTTLNKKKPYIAQGFVYIYNEEDFSKKIILGKMNNEVMQISHQNLKTGTLIKIINPKNKKSLVLKNIKRVKYPDFYKILITKPVADTLNLNAELPILEIMEIKKNKSFIAEKAKIYNEEKKISSKAPVASVKISNISKNKVAGLKKSIDNIYIHIASFYSKNTAIFLRDRITKEISGLDVKKLKIKIINSKKTQVILGPYNSVNLVKNDYIRLKNYGFEELDIFINE